MRRYTWILVIIFLLLFPGIPSITVREGIRILTFLKNLFPPGFILPNPTHLFPNPSCFSEDPPCCLVEKKIRYPIPKRLILSHNAGYGDEGGIYMGNDYSTLGIFLASDYTAGSFYPLIDLRAHRFDNDWYAFNIGIGARYVPDPCSCCCFCEMLGFNLFYDWREGCLHNYNQIGVGLEVLGRRWDLRANGYFPVGSKKFTHQCVFDDYIGDFIAVNTLQEITTYGFNLELGWLAIDCPFLLYFAAGPYYLTRKIRCFDESILGGEIRVRPQYRDYVALDIRFSHDSTFNTVWEATLILSLPLYQVSNQCEYPCCLTDRQIYQPIERFETMPLGRRSCWKTNF